MCASVNIDASEAMQMAHYKLTIIIIIIINVVVIVIIIITVIVIIIINIMDVCLCEHGCLSTCV